MLVAMMERRLHGLGLVALAFLFLFIIICQTTNTATIHRRRHPLPPTPTPRQENTTTTRASPTSRNNNISSSSNNKTLYLVTTLCVGKCHQPPNDDDCRDYRTPFQQCFCGSKLFPNDPSWNSTDDILDTPINATHFRREFFTTTTTATATSFSSSSTSCRRNSDGNVTPNDNPDDGFVELPYHECVGPFGLPRPWGSFHLLDDDDAGVEPHDILLS